MTIGVAVIGAGMAGRAHAAAFRAANSIYGQDLPPVRLVSIGDVNAEFGKLAADRFGYERADTDWRAIADDPNIHAVSVVVANHLHREIVEGLLAAGKHVLCEKPLSDTLESAQAMLNAANQSKTVAAIGFTYLRNPAVAAIRKLVASGQLGKVLHFSGRYWCDYSIDANTPISWRYKGGMGSGALADLGSHLIYVSEFITGKSIKAISGANFSTVIKERPVAAGVAFARDKVEITDQRDTVENDDYSAMIANFGDIAGSLETSRVAAGHPNSLIFEVFCEKGAAKFSFDHTGEFELQLNDGNPGSNGYRTVLVGPETPYISGGVALDVPGVGVSVNDQFYFQNRAFLQQVAGLPESAELPYCANFADGLHNMQVIDTATKSFAANGASVSVEAYEPTFLRKL